MLFRSRMPSSGNAISTLSASSLLSANKTVHESFSSSQYIAALENCPVGVGGTTAWKFAVIVQFATTIQRLGNQVHSVNSYQLSAVAVTVVSPIVTVFASINISVP